MLVSREGLLLPNAWPCPCCSDRFLTHRPPNQLQGPDAGSA